MNIDQFVEFEEGGRGVDVVLADRSGGGRHPREDDPPLVNLSLLADAPPRTLSITLHVHRALARECVASAGCFVPGLRGTVSTRQRPDGAAETVRPSERWFDRLAHRPPVEYLGAGLECVPTPAYPRMRELTEALFAAGPGGGWDPDEFVGFRVSVEHPVWNAEYLLSLDFTPPDEL
jgi:hypothetical protein